MAFERVHTVWDYCDGPREGLADYGGVPHRYKSAWDDAANNWANTFELTPVDDETFQLEIERWRIWRAWEYAFHSGKAAQESHPGYGGRNARYDELGRLIASRMASLKPLEVRVTADFRALPEQQLPGHMMREFEVQWGLPPDTSFDWTRER